MPRPKVLGRVTRIELTPALREELPKLTKGIGGYQSTCARINALVRVVDNVYVIQMPPRELDALRDWANRPDDGTWQEWARAVLKHNGLR